MCGIAGILPLKPKRNLTHAIMRMTRAMRHRGPDDEGFVVISQQGTAIPYGGPDTDPAAFEAPYRYAPDTKLHAHDDTMPLLLLGHRRLSILDLSVAGHQPMCTEDGRYWIVYNGEVYNFAEVRAELEVLGESFQSSTDTEVVLRAYRHWGPDCVQRFNGMWAFAIWDAKQRRLFCSRDRIGIKPFYYCFASDCFLFASDVKTLIASGLYPPEPNWEGVYHSMSFECAPRPMTAFKGVFALRQSHSMFVSQRGEIQQTRYWAIPLGQTDHSKSEAEWIEETEAAIRQAVKRRLVSDVPVGGALSGGLDSTTVAAMATYELPHFKGFTLGFEGIDPRRDEVSQAEATARKCGMQHVVERIHPETLLEVYRDIAWCQEEPWLLLNPSYPLWRLASNNGTTVNLCGLGGDELYCGYLRYEPMLEWLAIPSWKRSIGLVVPPVGWRLTRLHTFARYRNVTDCYVSAASWFTEAEKRQVFAPGLVKGFDSYAVFRNYYQPDRDLLDDPIDVACYYDLMSYVGNHHVYREDQFAMRFSLETRFPLLDHELVELAFRMPSSLKLNNGTRKYLLQRIASKWIDHSCLDTKNKKGFSLPWNEWFRGSLRPFLQEMLGRLAKRPFVRRETIERIANHGKTFQVWYLASLESWISQFFDEAAFCFPGPSDSLYAVNACTR